VADHSHANEENRPPTIRERQTAFIAEYAKTGNITRAAERVGISKEIHYQWMKKFPKYVEAFREAKNIAAEYLESVAVERASEGWLEPVYYQGASCGEVRRYSDGLMMLLLRGMMPEKYGYNKTEVTGPAGGPIETRITVTYVDPAE
jgi:hypothetical protein